VDVTADQLLCPAGLFDDVIEGIAVPEHDRVHRREPRLHGRMVHQDDAGFVAFGQGLFKPVQPFFAKFACVRFRIVVRRAKEGIEKNQTRVGGVDDALHEAVGVGSVNGVRRSRSFS